MRTSHKLTVIGVAVAPMAIITSGLALAEQPPAPPAPSTPAYICDSIVANQPAVFGVTNCQPYGGAPVSGFVPVGATYTLSARTGDPAGNVQNYRCSGGYADTPTTIAPKKCSAVGVPVQASLAPSAIPFTPAYSIPPAPPK